MLLSSKLLCMHAPAWIIITPTSIVVAACRWGKLTPMVARLVHDTCLAMMVTGSHVPPARLHTLKTSLHPDRAVELQCQDPDCLHRGGCKGNRFEIVAEGGKERVKYVAPHHKTERRQGGKVLTYMLPQGSVEELLLIHIKEGHAILCHHYGKDQPMLFMTRSGSAYDDISFPQWWQSFFESRWGPPVGVTYFPPTKGRNLFVEHYMATTGNYPEEWEGAACAMGNSVKQWKEHYAPRMRDRLAQEAVNSHQRWRDANAASAAGVGGDQQPQHTTQAQHQPNAAEDLSQQQHDEPKPQAWQPAQQECVTTATPSGMKRRVDGISKHDGAGEELMKKKIKVESSYNLLDPPIKLEQSCHNNIKTQEPSSSNPSSSKEGWAELHACGVDPSLVEKAQPPPFKAEAMGHEGDDYWVEMYVMGKPIIVIQDD